MTKQSETVDPRHVGQVLASARRRQRVTLDEAAVALRIPPEQLRALEEGKLSVFPAAVYARGAYVKYARYLGIGSDRVRLAFLRALATKRPARLRLYTPRPWLAAMLTPHWVLMAVVTAAALLVGSYVVFQVESFFRLPRLSLTEPRTVVARDALIGVAGHAESGVDILVNGEAVLAAADGTFATQLALHPGINVVLVEARNAAGRMRVIERHILFTQSDGG